MPLPVGKKHINVLFLGFCDQSQKRTSGPSNCIKYTVLGRSSLLMIYQTALNT